MNELNCKYCEESTECSEDIVAVTCSNCVVLLISDNLTENY